MLVCVGTLVSRVDWLAAVAMAVVAFGVLFAGVVSSVLAGATTSLLLAFILPVSLPGPVSTIPDRLAGWGMAAVPSLLAIALLWPAPARDPLRERGDRGVPGARRAAARATSPTCSAATRGRAARGHDDGGRRAPTRRSARCSASFFATPYRPTGLSTAARALVRLVDELAG